MFIYKLINFNIFNILYNLNIINISKSYHDQNARSGTRVPNAGVFLVLWIPEASESFFCSLQKGSAVLHSIFQKMFKVFLDPYSPINSITIKFVRGQILFFQRKKGSGKEI